jgi:hypothetical protein
MRRPQLDFNFLIPFGNDYFQFSSAKIHKKIGICKFLGTKNVRNCKNICICQKKVVSLHAQMINGVYEVD